MSDVHDAGVRSETGRTDALLACLGWIARYHGLGFTEVAALSGLPLDESGRLPPELVPRAAARCGLDAELVAEAPSSVAALVAPFIVFDRRGTARVVQRMDREGGAAWLVDPVLGPDEYRVPFDVLDGDASGRVVYLTPSAATEDAGAAYAGATNRPPARHWLWSPMVRLWPAWLKVLLAACLINILGLAVPLFVMQVYDRVLPNQTISTLWALTAGAVIAVVFDLALRQLRAVVLDHAGRLMDVKIASSIFQHVLSVPMAARQQSVGGIANQIREFETVRDVLTSASVIALTDLVFIGLVVAVMWIVAGPLAWIVILAIPVVIVLTLATLWPLGRAVRATVAHASRRHGVLVESLSATETLKAINAEGIMQRRWEDAVGATTRANAATRLWSTMALHLSLLVQQAVSIVIIVWGVFLVNDSIITVGALIAASMFSGRALAPLANIAMTITRLQQAVTAMRGINAIMALPSERTDGALAGETIASPAIELRALTFRYPGQGNPALDGISASIAPGERVGIVGRVGSGKSTLGRLLAKLYAPESGSVLIGGLDIAAVDAAEVRAAVGYVGQDTDLFEGTLRDNVTLGRRTATEDEIATALHLSGADLFVSTHPLGLSLPLRERGQGLSGGQRQAIGLARALLRRPKILFLDEPSSAMDTGTESEVVRRMAGWCDRDRVLIVCTHRLQLLELCDRVIVIDAGRIVADGPKARVLATLRTNAPAAAIAPATARSA